MKTFARARESGSTTTPTTRTVQLVGNAVPIVLDAWPVRRIESRIGEDLPDAAEDLVHVDDVLMDRESDTRHVLEMISRRGFSCVVPKRLQTSEKAQAKRSLRRDEDRDGTDRTASRTE